MSTANVKANLADHLAINLLLNRYTDAVNRRDWATLADVFTEDGIWDVGGPEAGPMKYYFSGRDQLVGSIRGMIEAMSMLVQTNHAPVIQVNGSRATATSTMDEKARTADGEQCIHLIGTYYDDIVRENDGEWRFKKRTFRITYLGQPKYDGQVMARFPVARPA